MAEQSEGEMRVTSVFVGLDMSLTLGCVTLLEGWRSTQASGVDICSSAVCGRRL